MTATRYRPQNVERSAFSQVEVLVALGIVATLIGLSLSAVQRVRAAALRADVYNRIRQITLANQSYVAAQGRLPPPSRTDHSRGGGNVFGVILPYLEQQPVEQETSHGLAIRNYMSPADPSFAAFPTQGGNCSFAVNSLTCTKSGIAIPEEITDGTSNTIGFSERYARCQDQNVIWSLGTVRCFNPSLGIQIPCGLNTDRRATFADNAFVDVLPRSGPLPGTTIGSEPYMTFQASVSPSLCDGRVVQAAFPSGLVVAMCDSSVHTIKSNIQPVIYWSLITPSSGEVVNDW